MRVAYICADPGVPVFGCKGSSVHVQEIIRALIKQGAEVDLFAARSGDDRPADLNKVRVHKLPALPKGDDALREKRAFGANADLRSKLESGGRYDLVYERYSLWSFAGMEFAFSRGIPGILEVNAPLIEEQEKHRSLIDRPLAEQTAKRVFGLAAALIAVSKPVADYLKSYPGAQGRIHVVPNGINPNRFSENVIPSCPAPPDTFTVGFIGTLKPWHGTLILMQAFAMLHQKSPDVRLLVVGDGPESAALRANISACGLADAVHLTGAVSPTEVPGLLASMDAAAAPYPAQEGFYFSPLKVYEYMAAGLPVAASRIGQIEDLIKHGVNGFLCSPGDPVDLAAALDKLRGDPDLCVRMGEAARATMVKNHIWDAAVRRILDIAEFRQTPRQPIIEAGN